MHTVSKGNPGLQFGMHKLLQNDFFNQRYITFNVTISGQDKIDPNTYMCTTFLLGI